MGHARDDVIEFEWTLSADEPITGFQIMRRDEGNEREQAVHDGLLPAAARRFVDETAEPGGKSYEYTLVALVDSGDQYRSQTVTVHTRRYRYALSQNFPNPFNPTTVIRYELAKPGNIELRIYDVSGALVRVLDAGHKPAGVVEATWDGTNQSGERVATGVYFYRLQTASFVKSRKMVLLK
jgi:hypothetical protein